MLNFHLNLQSPLFMNLKAYDDSLRECSRRKLNFSQAMEVVRDKFPDLTEEQFFELRYEWQEYRSVALARRRGLSWDIVRSDKVRTLLTARSEPEFAKNPYFIQFMGRGMRKGKG